MDRALFLSLVRGACDCAEVGITERPSRLVASLLRMHQPLIIEALDLCVENEPGEQREPGKQPAGLLLRNSFVAQRSINSTVILEGMIIPE